MFPAGGDLTHVWNDDAWCYVVTTRMAAGTLGRGVGAVKGTFG